MMDQHTYYRGAGVIAQAEGYAFAPGWHTVLPDVSTTEQGLIFLGSIVFLTTDSTLYRCVEDGAGGYEWVDFGAGGAGGGVSGAQVVQIPLGDGVAPIAAGIHKDVPLPSAGIWTGWTLVGTKFNSGSAGDLVVDLGIDGFANFPPTFATDSITGSDKPTLSADDAATSSALTGWDLSFNAGDVLRVNVEGSPTVRLATLSLEYTPVSAESSLMAMTIGDGVSVIPTGIALDFTMVVGGVWTEWILLATKPDGTPGSVVLDIAGDIYGNFPPTFPADSITGSDKPTLSAAQSNSSSLLTGWDTGFAAGDTFRINVDSASTLKLVTLGLVYQKAL